MTQTEFIHELEIQLKGTMPEEELREVLSDYESFFISGREEGRTDDQISAELGSPSYLAQSLREDQTNQVHAFTMNIAKPGKRLCAFLIDSVIAVLPALLFFLLSKIAAPVLFVLIFFYASPAAGLSMYVGANAFYQETSTTVSDGQNVVTEDRTIGKPSVPMTVFGYLSIAFYLFYALICSWLLHGQTLGKKLMHIRVRAATAEPASKRTIFYREFLGKVLINSIPIVPLASLFTLLFMKEHKTLHDMLADTIVTNG
ncbi:RDD family protein [Sporolactobacillus shoreicorticis]|uniref:RDD family protein n=1 Tax=Sporolactobacillus shoreicorticis TaxID=1923877 RepID=A0ABW5S2K7_9BACL|nr:RDD family protein [Sporolactobacillus shoreicorticis]MCO7127992.1 RDD family protein [Sporolactobacillus shoreicorticis]